MKENSIPEPLINQLLNNQLILFTGSGASIGAMDPEGRTPPTGLALRDILCDKFFSGELKDHSLSDVCDYIINEYDLRTLQEYIRELLINLEPAEFHNLIPKLPWHAIATTNYDLIVERSYQNSKDRISDIETFVQNGDKIDIKLKKDHKKIAYIKLHGCINHYTNQDIPLILSSEQLIKYSTNRDRLFNRLRDLGNQCSIVFCGYSIADNNIREILFDLTDPKVDRPRYYAVTPNPNEYFKRYWEKHRITIIESTFEAFLSNLYSRTTQFGRETAIFHLAGSTTLNRFYRTNSPSESPSLLQFLESDVTHIRPGLPTKGSTPQSFYSGYNEGWWPIEQELDVYRDIIDSIIVEAVLKPSEKNEGIDLFAIKGAAGNGKTVALKRAAWDAAHDYEQLVLFLHENGALNKHCIEEIFDLTGKRIFIMIDHVSLVVEELCELLNHAKRKNLPITIIASERDNEWNVRCGALEPYLKNEFSIGYLTKKEIHLLIGKLEKYKCLGDLEFKSPEARISAFTDRAQHQLLVALHEVTSGEPFEEIIKDEYDRIIPDEARYLYLDICTLHRLGVSIRAGLIARISGISFDRFEKELFRPLEHLVRSTYNHYLHDRLYETRHAYVAELVFRQALPSSEEIFEQITRVMRGMNIDYSSDNEAFTTLMRGRSISETFPNAELGRRLFQVAHDVAKDSVYVYHQEAVFEITHIAGSLTRAQRALAIALEKAPWDKSVQHTYANLKRKQANAARTDIEREKLRREAKILLKDMLNGDQQQPYGLFTYAQITLDQLDELLEGYDTEQDDKTLERSIAELSRLFEQCLSKGRQKFSRNEQFLLLEERFLTLFEKHEKATIALEKAMLINPRNEYIASRLAAKFTKSRKTEEAKNVLIKCLEANPSAKLAHLEIALLYMKSENPAERSHVIDHLRKSFTDGDSNLLAQFWYARELFISGRHPESQAMFTKLIDTPMSPSLRNEIRGNICSTGGTPIRYKGTIVTFENSFCFIKCSSFPVDIYAQAQNSKDPDWQKLVRYEHVEFEVAFTMKGPRGINLTSLALDRKTNGIST